MNENPFNGGPFGNGDNNADFGGLFDGLLKKKKQNKPQGDPGPEKFDSDGRPEKRHNPMKGFGFALGFMILVFAALNCYYVLDEENYAVVTTLGSAQAQSQAGLHFKIPFVQRVYMVSKGIKGMPIGYDPDAGTSNEEESIMITKDFNFVNTNFYVEYMVNDPVKYLYASEEPEATLKMLAQSYIRDTVGVYNVDDVITTGKAAIQSEIKEKLTNRMIEEDIGLSLVNITIQDAFPPTTEVMNAFKNVENAKQGKETAINNANKDRNEKIPQAEAECDRIIKSAEAEKEARINEAQGQVSRFEQMYAEYSKYPLITKQRMFYETMEELLPDMKVYIVDEGGTQKMLPLDSFTSAMQSGTASKANGSGTAGTGAVSPGGAAQSGSSVTQNSGSTVQSGSGAAQSGNSSAQAGNDAAQSQNASQTGTAQADNPGGGTADEEVAR